MNLKCGSGTHFLRAYLANDRRTKIRTLETHVFRWCFCIQPHSQLQSWVEIILRYLGLQHSLQTVLRMFLFVKRSFFSAGWWKGIRLTIGWNFRVTRTATTEFAACSWSCSTSEYDRFIVFFWWTLSSGTIVATIVWLQVRLLSASSRLISSCTSLLIWKLLLRLSAEPSFPTRNTLKLMTETLRKRTR